MKNLTEKPQARKGRKPNRTADSYFRVRSGIRYQGVAILPDRGTGQRIARAVRRELGISVQVDASGRNAKVRTALFPAWVLFIRETDIGLKEKVLYLVDYHVKLNYVSET